MKCPYCQDEMTQSKVEPSVFYCWTCLLSAEEDEEDGTITLYLPQEFTSKKRLKKNA